MTKEISEFFAVEHVCAIIVWQPKFYIEAFICLTN